jgi:hypothetical protein
MRARARIVGRYFIVRCYFEVVRLRSSRLGPRVMRFAMQTAIAPYQRESWTGARAGERIVWVKMMALPLSQAVT